MDLFWETASPTTLASLIADVECLGTGATREQLKLAERATWMLFGNVGEEEGNRLIERAVHGVMTGAECEPCVPPCPWCGAKDIDQLVFDDDGENVTCAVCDFSFDPSHVLVHRPK